MPYVTQQFSLELLRNLNESGFRVRHTLEDSCQQSLLRLIYGRLLFYGSCEPVRIPYTFWLFWLTWVLNWWFPFFLPAVY